METVYALFAFQLVLLGYQAIKIRNLRNNICRAQDKYLSLIKKNDLRLHDMYLSLQRWFKQGFLPQELRVLTLADSDKMILSVKRLDIPGVSSPYNGSIVDVGDGFCLFFRFDLPKNKEDAASLCSEIGCVRLQSDLTLVEGTLSKIDMKSAHSEDPRVFEHEGAHYLLFNDASLAPGGPRSLRLAAIDLETLELGSVTSFEAYSRGVEKNWTAFSHGGEIHFLYSLCPQKVLKVSDRSRANLSLVTEGFSHRAAAEWTSKWGKLRGGTPAKFVDGEYLAFFHSSFEDDLGIRWYVMGAYTFEANFPFHMTGISPEPILFERVYETQLSSTAHPGVRSIYPAGFTVKNGVIYLSCGENDSAIKIVSLDKEKLLADLIPIIKNSA